MTIAIGELTNMESDCGSKTSFKQDNSSFIFKIV